MTALTKKMDEMVARAERTEQPNTVAGAIHHARACIEYREAATPAVFTALCRVAGAAEKIRANFEYDELDSAFAALSEALGVDGDDD